MRISLAILQISASLTVFATSIFSATTAHALSLSEQQALSQKMNCSLSIGRKVSRNSNEVSPQFLCFRDEIVEAIQTSGCILRQIDGASRTAVSVLGLPGADSKSSVLQVAAGCEAGGIKNMLSIPVSETESVLDLVAKSPLISPRLEIIYVTAAVKVESEDLMRKLQERIDVSLTRGKVLDPESGRRIVDVKKAERTNVEVFFATDRKQTTDKTPAKMFMNERSDGGRLSLGKVTVSIPKTHRRGVIDAPSIFRFEFSNDPENHMTVKMIQKVDYDSFYGGVSQRVNKSARKEALVFVHGYATTFEYAALRTAQLTYDLNFTGAPIFYSWPAATMMTYLTAVAHSMGNRALTNALNLLAEKNLIESKNKFRHIILAAPDVDSNVFEQIAGSVSQLADSMTLYDSENDHAIPLSNFFHSFRRLGEAGTQIVSLPVMDSIDVSNIETSGMEHAYFGDSPLIMRDISKILYNNMRANQRSNLKKHKGVNGDYWMFGQ